MHTLARTWTQWQKRLIIAAVAGCIVSFGALVYAYEKYYRGPTDNVFVGTWVMEGCMDCTNLITLEPNHDAIGFGDYMGLEDQLDYRGRWYAGGTQLIIQYDDGGEGRLIVMKIQEITPNAIRLSWGSTEMRFTRSPRTPPQASNHAMQPPAGQPAIYVVRFCHSPLLCKSCFTGVAAADLGFR